MNIKFFIEDYNLQAARKINPNTNSTSSLCKISIIRYILIKIGFITEEKIDGKVFYLGKGEFQKWKNSHKSSFLQEKNLIPDFQPNSLQMILECADKYKKVPGKPLSKDKIKILFNNKFKDVPYYSELQVLLDGYLKDLKDGDPVFIINSNLMIRNRLESLEEKKCMSMSIDEESIRDATYEEAITNVKSLYPDEKGNHYEKLMDKINMSFAYKDIYPFLFNLPGSEHSDGPYNK
jgi:hypothetical protein